MTRNEYWQDYAKRLSALEKKYAPRVYRALMRQVRDFVFNLRSGMTGRPEIWNEGIAEVLRAMHIESGTKEGRYQLRRLKAEEKRFGINEEWTREIIELLRTHNARFVVSITETTRELLEKYLEEGLAEGLSLNEIAAKIERVIPPIYTNRSFAIARTELNRGSNMGTMLAAKTYRYETEKVWITAKDHRVRGTNPENKFSHVELDGIKIDSFDSAGNPLPFNNGEPITQPGDPNASPGNTINCRCTIALVGKRDANGRLIRKTSLLQTFN